MPSFSPLPISISDIIFVVVLREILVQTMIGLGVDILFLHLHAIVGTLTIGYADRDRVKVTFHGGVQPGMLYEQYQGGTLTDPKFSEADDQIMMVSDPEIESEFIYLTVDKSLAASVLVDFFDYQTFASELVWLGNMSMFSQR